MLSAAAGGNSASTPEFHQIAMAACRFGNYSVKFPPPESGSFRLAASLLGGHVRRQSLD
jgi:hypothetical protein